MQWLKEIPSHWYCIPVKRICTMKSGNNITSLDISDEGPYPVFGANGMRGYYDRYNVDGDYLLIGRQGALSGNVHHYRGKFWATDHALITHVKRENINYIYYALIAINLNQYAFGTAAQPGLAASKIMALSIPIPPLAEQERIVSYLEDKTSKIDAYVAEKEKEIQLLQELKQKTIADAVTKGLNPDVKMKDSGISWIGMIPEHWETKRIASMFTGKVNANSDFGYKHAFKFNYGTLVPKNEVGDTEEYRDVYVKYSVIREGDILINGLNLNYDFISQRVAIAPSDGIITSAYVVARPRTGTNAHYYTYLFKTMDSMKLFHGMGTGIRLTLSFDELKKQLVIVPSQDEQRAIVAYIDEKCQKIDTLMTELQAEIDYMKEYKQRLIADCVTGQVNVQNETT
ncbi:MAG: restriction endonuclease subunit S [Prevotella sp.]|nr:restriction endonuclease subunit S [Prevotella sp.]